MVEWLTLDREVSDLNITQLLFGVLEQHTLSLLLSTALEKISRILFYRT